MSESQAGSVGAEAGGDVGRSESSGPLPYPVMTH